MNGQVTVEEFFQTTIGDEATEQVILVLQDSIYRILDELQEADNQLKEAARKYREAESRTDYLQKKIVSVVAFLDLTNHDALDGDADSWLDILSGISEETRAQLREMALLQASNLSKTAH